MTLDRLIASFHTWIDQVAGVIAFLLALRRGAGAVRVSETGDGLFTLLPPGRTAPFRLGAGHGIPGDVAMALAGRPVELILAPSRFLFCPLELPRGAAAFLDGIVRAQIDRLTPWSASEAAFGYGPPEDLSDERMGVTVAAMPRARIAPLVAALKAQGMRAVTVLVLAKTVSDDPIRVMDDGPATLGADQRIRRVLLAVLWGSAAGAALALLASDWQGAALDAERDEVRTQLAAARQRIITAREGLGSPALHALEARKYKVPASVLLLEVLSDVLPDDTYVTELRMDADKVEIAGLSREAPGLIRRLEQSKRFAEATFIAPTLRQPGEAGERFHIEARILLPQELPR